MKHLLPLVVLSFHGVLSSPAAAQGFYIDGGLQYFDFPGKDLPHQSSFSYNTLTLRAGSDVTRYFGVEAELITGIKGDTGTTSVCPEGYFCAAFVGFELPVDLELRRGAGIFLTAKWPVHDAVALHGRAGRINLEQEVTISLDDPSESETDTDSASAVGIGALFTIREKVRIRVDLSRLQLEQATDASVISLSCGWQF